MWDEGIQSAVCLTFDLDAESVWIGEDPDHASRPVALSQGRYGPQVGLPLVLELLDRCDIQATFFVPGVVAEAHPKSLERIVAGGHELALHGYTHLSPAALTPEEEERALVKSKGILGRFDQPILGYRSPSWELSEVTLSLLQRHGLLYSSNMMDSLHPYLHRDSQVIELPVHWALDDAPHFWFDSTTWDRVIAAPSQVEEIWQGEFQGIHELGGVCVLTLHPQIIARPHRLQMLERWLDTVHQHSGVWIAPAREIARRAQQALT